MFVGACQLTLHIPTSASLKDKRQVVRSLTQRLRNEFSVASSEVDTQDTWQIATLGISCVSGDAGHAEEVLENAVRYVERTRPDLFVTDVHVDVFPFGD